MSRTLKAQHEDSEEAALQARIRRMSHILATGAVRAARAAAEKKRREREEADRVRAGSEGDGQR